MDETKPGLRITGEGTYEDQHFEYEVIYDGRARQTGRSIASEERRDRGDVTKAVRYMLRAGAHQEWTQSQLRRLVSKRLGRDVSQAQVNSSLWVLCQNGEAERTGAKKGGAGHSWDPDETTYRWKGDLDDATSQA